MTTTTQLGWEESMDTLEKLLLPSIHSSEIYVHNWQPGDLVLVDNIALFHSVTPFDEWSADPPTYEMQDVRRLLHRTVRRHYPLFCSLIALFSHPDLSRSSPESVSATSAYW